MQTITVFRGDGIGPEITDAVLEILDAAGAQFNYEIFDVGEAVYQKNGEFIPQKGLDSFDKTKVLLKSLFKDIDIVTFRENTEDLYVGKEEVIDDNTVIAYKIITKKASKRIIKSAFEYAITHNRKKVTCVHKANILKKTDGLFLSIFEEIAKDYPQIEANALIVDNTCMQLVMHPQQFDVMVMPNLYGDIISDLTSGLIGGLGLLPSCNKGDTHAMYEAVHGSAPDIAGKGIANPTALLLSSCMMLEDLGQQKTAIAIRKAVDEVFADKTCLTPDLGGNASTKQFVQSIIDHLKKDEG